MATCEVCGNEYDKSFELTAAGARHVFDSFECAIQAASTASAGLLATESKWADDFSAAPIAHDRRPPPMCAIGRRRCGSLFSEPPSRPNQNATAVSAPPWLVN